MVVVVVVVGQPLSVVGGEWWVSGGWVVGGLVGWWVVGECGAGWVGGR